MRRRRGGQQGATVQSGSGSGDGRQPAPGWRARLGRALRVLALLVAAAPWLQAQAGDTVARSALPGWVDVRPLPDGKGTAPAPDGLRYLQLEDQVLLGGPRPQWFRAVAYEVVRDRALAEAGQFSIEFQPAFQDLALHAVDVVRDGRVLDRLPAVRIEVMRREADLETRMLDGRLTAHVTIPDLRTGDRVVYRYTVTGTNPVFGGEHYDGHTLRFSTALAERRVRYVAPETMPLRWRLPEVGYTRDESVAGGRRTVTYSARRLPKVVEEDGTPGGFDPYGTLEVTTAADWGAVGRWAAPLYAFDADDPALVAAAAQLRLADGDREAALLRAVAFVQGEVRYTAIDLGTRAYAPNTPALVLERRFGDCKDKSMLLVALLARAGIDARPVLVNTVRAGGVEALLPRPTAFDHVVVQARLDGREVWIDATLDRETGPLAQRDALPYGAGLPAGGDALVAIPQPVPPLPQVDVAERIRLVDGAGGDDAGHVLFGVATDYRGGEADRRRASYEDGDLEAIGADYVDYMADFHPGIAGHGAPSGQNVAGDGFRTLESYRLARSREDDGAFDVVLFQLSDWVPRLEEGKRRQPLALGGVRSGRQVIRVDVAGGWTVPASRDVVENRWFRFVRDVRVDGDDLVVTGEWTRLADSVAAADHAVLRADAERARELLWFPVQTGAGWRGAFHDVDRWRWPAAGLLLFGLLAGATWALRHWLVPAAMACRPRVAMAAELARGPRWWLAMACVMALAACDAAWSREVSTALGGVDAAWLRFAIDAGAVLLSTLAGAVVFTICLNFTGVRASLARQWLAACWASLPGVIGAVCAIVAVAGEVSVMADDVVVPPSMVPGAMVANLLVVAGGLWAVVAWVNLAAVAAGCRRRRIMAVLLAWLLVLGAIVAIALGVGNQAA